MFIEAPFIITKRWENPSVLQGVKMDRHTAVCLYDGILASDKKEQTIDTQHG